MSSRLQTLLQKILSVVYSNLTHDLKHKDVDNNTLIVEILGAVSLLMWSARSLLMQVDVGISLPGLDQSSSFSWQQVFVDCIMSLLLHGKMHENCVTLLQGPAKTNPARVR